MYFSVDNATRRRIPAHDFPRLLAAGEARHPRTHGDRRRPLPVASRLRGDAIRIGDVDRGRGKVRIHVFKSMKTVWMPILQVWLTWYAEWGQRTFGRGPGARLRVVASLRDPTSSSSSGLTPVQPSAGAGGQHFRGVHDPARIGAGSAAWPGCFALQPQRTDRLEQRVNLRGGSCADRPAPTPVDVPPTPVRPAPRRVHQRVEPRLHLMF